MLAVLLLLLSVSVLLQGSVISLPLALICLLCFLIRLRSRLVFVAGFVAGLLLDIFTLQPLGSEAVYFLLFLYLVILYQKKYEINSYPFVAVSSFIGSYFYLLFFGNASVLQAGISSVIAVVLFTIIREKREA